MVVKWVLLLLLVVVISGSSSQQSSCSVVPTDHILTVSDTGNDTVGCLEAVVPCLTLEYALQTHQLSDNTVVRLNYSTNTLHVLKPIHVSHRTGLVILGASVEQQVLWCDFGAGIAFEDVDNVCIENVAFQGCSILHKTTAFHPSVNETFPAVSSALFFYHSMNLTVHGCTFTSDRGSGISMYDVGGEVLFKDSLFFNNTLLFSCHTGACYNKSVGIYIEKTYCGNFSTCDFPVQPNSFTSYSSYTIENCTFYLNNNTVSPQLSRTEAILSYKEHRTLAHGGGLSIRLTGRATLNTFQVTNCNFTDNHALWGGGMEVGIGDDSSSNTVSVSESSFTENQALTGGGLRFGFFPPINYSGLGTEEKNNSYSIIDCVFNSNRAVSAGAISYISTRQNIGSEDSHLTVTETKFIDNCVNTSGAAIVMSAWYSEVGGFPTRVTITDCLFEGNRISMKIDETKMYGYGAVYTEDIPLVLSGANTFIQNHGSALVVSSTTVFMRGNILFQKNIGVNGGAIHLAGIAWVTLSPNLNLTFDRNEALLSGGAIFSAYSIPYYTDASRYCIIEFKDKFLSYVDQNITVNFLYNVALVSGQAIYLSTPGGCYTDSNNSLPFMDENIYHYESDDPHKTQITTPPGQIEFGPPAENQDGVYITQVTLGQPFQINPVSKDVFNQSTEGSAVLSLICARENWQCNGSDTGYNLKFDVGGQKLIGLNNTKITTPFNIIGPEDSDQVDDAVLVLLTNTVPSAVGYLHLNITPCPVGYVYSKKTHKCECFTSEQLYCGVEHDSTCIKYGYWFGPAHNTFTIANCPNSLCNYSNGDCPTEPCNDAFQSFCKLPKFDSDKLCDSNRGGIMCSSCKPRFQFTFDALKCVPENSCSAGNTILLVFFLLVFWTVLVLVLLLVLKLKLRLGSGHLYCLIYYYGVLPYLTKNTYPFFTLVLYTFGGFIQVEPRFLGLIEKCFASGLNNIQHSILRYIHPLFISVVMLLIIGVTRCWPRFATISRENYGVRALCILLYLSFTSLTETSLSILNFIRFENVSGVYVKIEPTISYFDPSGHLPYALVAIFIQVFIVIPYLFILLFSPCLARIHRVNLTRIKPILDEYQACYKTKYRWFAGYYLVCRQFVFIFSLIDLGEFGGIFFLQILSILVLVIHTAVQPYRSKWLNILDTVFLADLAIYSLFNGSTANVVLGDAKIYRLLAVHVLVLIPVVYFAGLCALKLMTLVYNYCRGRRSSISLSLLSSQTRMLWSTRPARSNSPNLEREPLIFSSDESTSYTEPEANIPNNTKLEANTSWFKRVAQKGRKKSTLARPVTEPPSSQEMEGSCSVRIDVRKKGKYTVSVVGAPDSQEN